MRIWLLYITSNKLYYCSNWTWRFFIGNLPPLTLRAEIERGWPGRRRVPCGPKRRGGANCTPPHFLKDKACTHMTKAAILCPILWAMVKPWRLTQGRSDQKGLGLYVSQEFSSSSYHKPACMPSEWPNGNGYPSSPLLCSLYQWQGHAKGTLDEKPQWQPHTSLPALLSSSCSASPGHTYVDLHAT